MKVQLVVVQGKPEGKSIPLPGPNFKIGRGDGCHLRPQSDLVSREHAEFTIQGETLILEDLGSRNGTEVNGKKLEAKSPVNLKNGDLVKIGTLTFAVALEMAVAAKAEPVAAAAAVPKKPRSLDDVSGDDIDAWLVSDGRQPVPERPSGVYGGDTMTISTYNGKGKSSVSIPAPPRAEPVVAAAPAPAPAPAPPAPPVVADEPEPEEIEEVQEEEAVEEDMGFEDLAALQEREAASEPDEFIDESNPFHVAKKAQAAPLPSAGPTKGAPSKDSSDAAGDILRKMMDRRKASKS